MPPAAQATGRALRIGYVPTALRASIPRTLRRLVATMPNLQTTMEPGSGLELVDAVRAGELDVAVVSLPVPTAGLRVTPLGEQRAVAVFPVGHEHAVKPHVGLEQIAPERIVVLPRDADRPFYDAVLATCCAAGISPTLIEMPDGQVDRVLLAVASGAGMALLPECVGERYADAGVRFVPLNGESPVLATAIVSPRHTEHLPTVALSPSRVAHARPAPADRVGQIRARRMRLRCVNRYQAARCGLRRRGPDLSAAWRGRTSRSLRASGRSPSPRDNCERRSPTRRGGGGRPGLYSRTNC